ncbi:Golgi integral membrane protein 4a isoform X1 [Salmo salar]|uniref:Golgi integral membrane protein 4a isoform X1 n=1 Tax=Salmo salar TaxID=8030 RepID=A0A1S3NUP7_SALSA|nr:Golgi integral membrane protein 4 isoform X1 [Salmo salar]|eukprot:XP_014018971.1 PREDICTED: Golgi integral membrane protein 4-like isoform X1 [Salmo salar]
MGNGVCSRRQRRIFQSLLLITVVFGIIYGGMISYEMHKQLKRTEAMAAKYQQHQESLSAQLQVVYEHRSRLEKSLQKERVEHKKAKEDYLVYKLEAQQSLNKEKQDSSSRLNSLHGQHQMLKKQHEDLKKQHYDLQEQHQIQGEDHGKALNEHKVRFDKLQQTKEMEASKLKENVYNLREENRQLRKAHQDIHVQLQDARIVHKDLKAAHDQLALTLEDHKSALAAAQVQVDEFKHLKETLIRMPSLRHDQNPAHQQAQPAALLAKAHEQGPPLPQPAAALLAEPHIEAHTHEEDHADTQSRLHLQEEVVGKPEFQSQPAGSHHAEKEGYGETEGEAERSRELAEGEAERRRELAEEEMEQAGQPQKLEEESEQPQEDEGLEAEHDQPDINALNRQRRQPQQDPESDIHLVPETHLQQEAHVAQAQVGRVKSAYEQQQVQQRLEAERAQRTKELQLRQEALLAQRMSVQREREQRLRAQHEREEQQQHREEDRREQLLKEEQLRKKSDYENMNNDIVQGDEEPHIDDDEERDTHLEEEKQEEEDHRVPQLQGAVEGEVDPEDDPNNQGEDEFDVAEEQHLQHREEEEADIHLNPNHPAIDEELVMAVNPDQQEDNLDDQYPEEDEVQEDLAGGQKREEEPYNEEKGEHEEVKDQEVPAGKEAEHRKEGEINEEENYEEEEEEEVGVGRDKRPNRREM